MRLGESGIENTTQSHLGKSGLFCTLARCVGKNTFPNKKEIQNFAVIIANLPTEENWVWTMKLESAKYAEKSSSQINIQSKSAALENAPVSYVGIKGIRMCGKQPVYNMEVDEYHNFSVNGGVIVHNCMDAVRYLCNTVMWREI